MTAYQFWTLGVLAVTAAGGIGLLAAALVQIKELVKQVREASEANKLGRLNALLALEQSIADKRLVLSEAGIALDELSKAADEAEKARKTQPATLRFEEAKQMYLNALDRLCYSILRDFLNEDELRADYRKLLETTIKDFRDVLGVGTEYRNIVKLHEKWADT